MNFDKNRKNIITGIENQMEILQGEYDLLYDKSMINCMRLNPKLKN